MVTFWELGLGWLELGGLCLSDSRWPMTLPAVLENAQAAQAAGVDWRWLPPPAAETSSSVPRTKKFSQSTFY